MKPFRLSSVWLSVAVLAALANLASAQVTVYSDDFSGAGGALNGAVEDTQGAAWVANSAFNDNGTVNLADEGSALLPFSPTINATYELSVDLTNPGNEWFGLGFAQDGVVSPGASNFDDRFSNAVDGIAWMLYRNNGGVDAVQSFTGLNVGGAMNLNTAGLDFNASNELKVILDTTGDGSNFTADWLINGNSLRSETINLPVASLNFVGLTYNNTADMAITFDNFLLTELVTGPTLNEWTNTGGGDFGTGGNWSAGVPTNGSSVLFGDAIEADATVNVNVARTLDQLQFNNGDFSYTISGDPVTLSGSATLSVLAGEHEIASQIGGAAGLTKTGPGVATLTNAANNYTGTTTVSGGTLQVTTLGALNQASGVTQINAGAQLQFGGDGAGGGASGSLTEQVTGDGTVRLATSLTSEVITAGTANNAFGGAMSVGGGTLRVINPAALGTATGATAVDGGDTTGKVELAGVVVAAEPLTLGARTAGNTASHVSSTSSSTWGGPITGDLGGEEYNIESQTGTLTLSGAITLPDTEQRNLNLSGAGDGRITGAIVDNTATPEDGADVANVNVYKRGTGTWTIATRTANLDDFHQGITVIEEGTLAVEASVGDDGELWTSDTQVRAGAVFDVTSFGTYSMQEGGLALSGAGTVRANTLEIFSDNTLNPGDSVGTLRIEGNVAMSDFGSGGAWNYELGNTTAVGGVENDLVQITGSLTGDGLNVTLNITPVEGTLATGTYRLMTHSSGSAPSVGSVGSQFVDNNGAVLNSRQSISVSSTNTQVNAIVTGLAQALTWNGSVGNNTWDVGVSAPWTGSASNFRDLDAVTFGAGGVKDVVISERVTPGSVTFNGGGGSTYTLTGAGGITGYGAISVNSGTVVLANSGNDFVGPTTVASGARLDVFSNAQVGSVTVNGTLALPNTSSSTLIDDFEDASLAEYTFAKILDQGTVTNTSFQSPAGLLANISAGADGAEQSLLFRGDNPLAVGEELRADAEFDTLSGNDLGLAVGVTPTDLGNGVSGDNRSGADFLFISLRGAGQINSRGFNGGGEVGQVQGFGLNVDQLFIARTGEDTIELGWYDGGVRNVLRTETVSSTAIFNNIGFYGDLRADGAGYSGLDDLRIATGAGAELVTVDGDFTLDAAGTLEVDLTESGFAMLDITGAASLLGTLDINLVGGFMPNDGQQFTLLSASEITSGIGDLTLDLPENFSAEIVGLTDLVLTFALPSGLLGDSNGDGVVNTLDIDAFVLALTDPSGYAAMFPDVDFLANNDIDMDGVVNTLDIDPFVALLTGGVTSVPEPSAATLLLLAGLAGVAGRRRA